MQIRKIRTRIPIGILIVVLFCFIYVITVNQLLSEETYVNLTPVGSNEKYFDFLKMIFCILLSVIAYRFAFVNMRNQIAWFTIRILFVSYALPTIMSFCLFSHEKSFEFIIAFIIYWFFLCICCKYITYDFRILKTNSSFNIFLKIFLPLFCVFAVFFMINSLEGFQLSLSLGNVYEVRQNFKENSNDIFVFLKSAFGIFVCPAMIVYAIYRNHRFNMAVFSIMQVLLFSFAKDKLYLMLLAVAYLIGFLGRKIYEAFDIYLHLGMITICVGMIIALMGVAQNFLFNIVIRRFLVTPAQLNYIYFEFFYNRPKVWWHQEVFFIDKFLTPKYDCTISQLIGEAYFKGMVPNPNAGMLAEAFSQCGWLGIIIYPILIACFLNILNYFLKNVNRGVQMMISFSLVMVISNDTITSTSFIIIMIVLIVYSLMFYERKVIYNEEEIFVDSN